MLHSTLSSRRRIASKYGNLNLLSSTPAQYPKVSSALVTSPSSLPGRMRDIPFSLATAATNGKNTTSTSLERLGHRPLKLRKPLHIKILLCRLLPPELVFTILSLASVHRCTAFIRTRVPLSYRERQIVTPSRIFQRVPPTLHLLSSPHSVCGIGDHPLRSVKFHLRFCLANLPNVCVSFRSRLLRDKRIVEGSDTLLFEPTMDGKLQSRAVTFTDESCLVKLARVGDRIGLWVMADGGLYGDWQHVPGHKARILVELREASIECFCCW